MKRLYITPCTTMTEIQLRSFVAVSNYTENVPQDPTDEPGIELGAKNSTVDFDDSEMFIQRKSDNIWDED